MITIPDDYADLFNDIRDTIYDISDHGWCITALNNILADILSYRNSEDWYYNLQYAKKQLNAAINQNENIFEDKT